MCIDLQLAAMKAAAALAAEGLAATERGNRSPTRRISILQRSSSQMSVMSPSRTGQTNTVRPGSSAGGVFKPHPPQSPSGSERAPGRKAFAGTADSVPPLAAHQHNVRASQDVAAHTALSSTGHGGVTATHSQIVATPQSHAVAVGGEDAAGEDAVWRGGKTFRCMPGAVRFGVLELRKLYRMKLTLMNVGVGFAKFRIRQVCAQLCGMPPHMHKHIHIHKFMHSHKRIKHTP
jgi:hypothetical protein